jgi:hypothetical protein
MKVIYNNLIPFKGFCAINLFGVIFARKDCIVGTYTLNHEKIHTAQMRELGYVPFYILYFIEWVIRLAISPKTAYRNISFEREAYIHKFDTSYLDRRRRFAQWRN